MASRISDVQVIVNRPSQPSWRVSRNLDRSATFRSQIRSQRAMVARWQAAGPADSSCYQGASTSRCGLSSNSSSKQPYGTPPGVYAARRVPGDKVPPAVDRDPVARVVQAGLDLPRTMPAPPRALSHPVIPCVTPIPMGPRKDPPFGPTSQAGHDRGGGPSEHDRPGRHAFAPIHRANAVVQHARPLQHGRRCSPLSSTPRCFGLACSETSCRRAIKSTHS
jgi:hypothetical protein